MKKKSWIWISISIAVVVLATIIYVILMRNPFSGSGLEMEEMDVQVQKVVEQKLGETILVTGKIVPENEQKIYLDSEHGEVHTYHVEENAVVEAGQPLFSYDTTKVDGEYSKAVRSRDLIQSRLKIEQNEIATLTKQIEEMKKKLNGEEGITQSDINAVSKEKVQLEIGLEATKDELTSAQEMINELAMMKKKMTVVSKINGVVVKVNKNLERTENGSPEPVIHIISNEPFKVIGTMSEFDTVKIQPEQDVIIRPKVFKDREWKGVVESVSAFPEGEGGGDEYYGGTGGGVTMYPFKVAITDDTSDLRQGFHVSLEISMAGNEAMLAVPHMALQVDEEGADFVYVLVEDKLEKRLVQTGEMNDEFMGIVEGVSLGELVVVMPDERMHDGMEVVSFVEIE